MPADPVLLASDASAHQHGGWSGGAACLIREPGKPVRWLFSSKTGTSVERMELEVMLDALATLEPPPKGGSRRVVMWFCDRANLAAAVTRDPATGLPGCARSRAAADLWARFDYLETLFDVTGIWAGRNTVQAQAKADELSGLLRLHVRDFHAEHQPDAGTWLFHAAPLEARQKNE